MVGDRRPAAQVSVYEDVVFDEDAMEAATLEADEAAFQAWVDFSEGQCEDDEEAQAPPKRVCVARGNWRLQVAPSRRSQPAVTSPSTSAVPTGTAWGSWSMLRERLLQFFHSWPSNAPLMAAPIPQETAR